MTNMERAKKAINEVFSDTSKEPEDTRDELLELKSEIENCLNCLDEM